MDCTAKTPTEQRSTTDFLQAIFAAGDRIMFRPIEAWTENGQKKSRVDYKGVKYTKMNGNPFTLDLAIRHQNTRAEQNKTNVFYGVCPRFGREGHYELAWQIRTVRVLWSDVDHCTVDEARERCTTAGLPPPSIIVASGNGAHIYWILAAPYLIDDVGDPQPVFTEFIDQGGGKKKKARKFLKGDGDEKIYIDGKDKRNAPPLSQKAQHVQDILSGIAAKIDGDHTTDLSRLLRVPGTLNRKDQRNGREPVPCTLVECDPQRHHAIADFAQYAAASPAREQREKLAKVKLPARRPMTSSRQDRFHTLLLVCDTAAVGSRSDADFALCAWGIENGMDAAGVWAEAQNVGKFKEAGERYFQRTWDKAAAQTQQKIYNKAVAIKTKRKDAPAETPESFPLTDTGLAERFALQHGDDVRYCFPWVKYLVWDGTRWKIDDGGMVDQLGKQTVRGILREAADEPNDERSEALVAFAKSSESISRRNAMLTLARSEPPIPITPEVLDKNAWILNCSNGKLDLRTGQLCEHRREDYITKLCPVESRSEATCPTWLATLDKCFGGDVDLIAYVQRFAGYCLTGDVSEQVLNIWHGIGANGKSTILNAMMEMMGPDYSMKGTADLLLMKYNDAHPTALTDLHGKRLVACIETDEGRRLAESLVKELTGGDPIRARRMREDFWQFWPTHKVVLACNHRPTVRGTDHAIWRRLKLVPFNVVIPPDERDKQLPAKLREELPGILAWAVRGCLDWQQHGLGEPKAVIDATADYQSTEDVLLNFIGECCVIGHGTKAKASDLLAAYKEWSGDKHVTAKRLAAALTERGIERYTNNGVWYRGIGLSTTEG